MDALVNARVRAYAQLLRLPNVCTSIADVLAGYLYVGGGLAEWKQVVPLAAASACIYAGGVALNDVCDVERDRSERPERPIPSGRIARSHALAVAAALLAAGVIAAALVSTQTALIAGGLVVAVVLYDSLLKRTPLAPATMGLCRALNLTLGMSIAGLPTAPVMLVPIALLWVYIASVTFFARKETRGGSRGRLLLGAGGVVAATAGLGVLPWLVAVPRWSQSTAALGLAILLAWSSYPALATRSPEHVQRTVRNYILALILFDACIVWASRGAIPALCVAAVLVPTVLLLRMSKVT